MYFNSLTIWQNILPLTFISLSNQNVKKKQSQKIERKRNNFYKSKLTFVQALDNAFLCCCCNTEMFTYFLQQVLRKRTITITCLKKKSLEQVAIQISVIESYCSLYSFCFSIVVLFPIFLLQTTFFDAKRFKQKEIE